MSRNIVICCDGTANQFAQDRTNVVKLCYTLEQDPARQIAFYHPGLGTMEPAGALTPATRKITRLLGMAVGYGLANDVRDAYTFLMNNYQDRDSVYLFGFSRGAYTARAVCSLLRMYGLIHAGNDPLVPYAVRMMMAIEKARAANSKNKKPLRNKTMPSRTTSAWPPISRTPCAGRAAPRISSACGTRSVRWDGRTIR